MTDQSSAVAVGMRSNTDRMLLRRRGDDVEVAQVPLGVVQLELELEFAGEVELRDGVDVVDRRRRASSAASVLRASSTRRSWPAGL